MIHLSSREFNQDTSVAKKQTLNGPVIITDRGKPAHVLLTFDDYEKLKAQGPSFLEIIAQEDGDDFDYDLPKLVGPLGRAFEFE